METKQDNNINKKSFQNWIFISNFVQQNGFFSIVTKKECQTAETSTDL